MEKPLTLYGLSFNSILVRLKVGSPLLRMLSRSWFQFHTGSIKSSVVREGEVSYLVSIPYWFD